MHRKFLLVLLINYCVIFHMSSCKPTFVGLYPVFAAQSTAAQILVVHQNNPQVHLSQHKASPCFLGSLKIMVCSHVTEL